MTTGYGIGIAGINGRMGQAIHACLTRQIAGLAGTVFRGGASRTPAGETFAADTLFKASDCIIDFTKPEALAHHLALARANGTALVIGTTGFSKAQEDSIREAAKDIPIVYAANMSIGVNILLALVEKAAAALPEHFDIEIVETHHRNKVDAPSGTALALGRAAAKGRGIALEDHMAVDREGARKTGDIGFAVMRGGDVIGEHTVGFFGPAERIELTHKAADRALFAEGAVRAALWLKGRAPGLYSMRDVLGLS